MFVLEEEEEEGEETDWPASSRDPSISASPAENSRHVPLCLALYMEAKGLNSGLRTCAQTIDQPKPKPLICYFFLALNLSLLLWNLMKS